MSPGRILLPTTPDDWARWRDEGCDRLPVVLTIGGAALPDSWEGFTDRAATVLLESASGGRYSFLCDRASRVVTGDASGAEIRTPDGVTVIERRSGSPLTILAALLRERRVPKGLTGRPLTGGFFGVFGYDLVRTWERLPQQAKRDATLPLYAMIEPEELFIYDHVERALSIVIWTDLEPGAADPLAARHAESLEQAERALVRWQSGGGGRATNEEAEPALPVSVPPDSFSRAEFEAAVRQIHSYLERGHTYQTNLSLRHSRPASSAATAVYEALRRVNPSPYMGLLRLPPFTLVCGSPELLVRLTDGLVSSRPIAGTRPRGANQTGDQEMSAELLVNEKERAEHLMLVDLIRNDIGRVAAPGSVHVPEFMAVERYSHVMHLVSQVEGRLAAGKDWTDVLRSMFPGGTITGCPKVRTMEIIEELEPIGRQYYTGSLGWISYGGEMELNIIIRSMLVHQGVAHVQAGAGIVADSRPEREFDEAMHKARALWVAWEMAARHG